MTGKEGSQEDYFDAKARHDDLSLGGSGGDVKTKCVLMYLKAEEM